MQSPLPSPTQTWAHAVDSRASLLQALQDDGITAIETDLLMGQCTTISPNNPTEKTAIPIMAHPPHRTSDLSMTDFMDLILISKPQQTKEASAPSSAENGHKTKMIIKLDFKELETVEPTLKEIFRLYSTIAADNDTQNDHSSLVFFLNADILPGPGRREEGAVTITADVFLTTCLNYIRRPATTNFNRQTAPRFAFSLGYKTDYIDRNGYTPHDIQSMSKLIHEYKLADIGVVLAVNARQLALSMLSFDPILAEFPDLQLLAWTGKGEPPIPKTSIETIQNRFSNVQDRIGFDCQVSESE
jgi:hypothetical protein